MAEANYPGDENVLSVFVTPPAYLGSGKDLQYAESGKVVKYQVTAVPATGDTLTIEGEGEAADGGTVSGAWPWPAADAPPVPDAELTA